MLPRAPPLPLLPPAPPQKPPPPSYAAPPQLPAPPETQLCNAPQQKLHVATPQPGLHFICREFKELACCPDWRTKALAQELLEVSLRPTCWAPHTAQKCAIECDPEAITWDWIDFEGGDPYLCRETCERYYVDCLAEAPHTADQPYGFYANMSEYCDAKSRDTNCLHVPLSPPSPPPHIELPPLRVPNWALIFAAMLGVLALCCSFAGLRMRVDKWLLRKREEMQRQEAEVAAAQLQPKP